MESFITACEAAAKWGVKKRRVLNYCKDGRVDGARRFGRAWQIPSDAAKPEDPRKKRKTEKARAFTLPKECPNLIMTDFYNKSGEGSRLAEGLQDDEEAQSLFVAELLYFRGETEQAAKITKGLLEKTPRRDVKIGSTFILCLCAMYEGNAATWIYARETIANIPCGCEEDEAVRDFWIGNIDSALYDKNSFPTWFKDGDFSPLPRDCYPMARFAYLKWLLMEFGDPGISKMCGPLISQCRVEGAVLAEIYCLILTSIGFHDRGDNKKAACLIDRAIELALPDGLFSPFAEYRNQLGILLDERLSMVSKTAAKAVRDLYNRLINGWTILCRQIRGVEYVRGLTQREFQAAKLAAKGLPNAEIASRMCLSVNTVKRYISEAIGKTGVADRTELKEIIILGGDTLP